MENIVSDRLIIRRFTENDWQDLYEYLSDEEVVRFEPYDTYSEEQAKEEVINRARNEIFYAVTLKDSGKVIGNLTFIKGDFDTYELGYVFNRKYHGKGYATEGAKTLIEYGFSSLGARRIIAMCSSMNKPSWKLLERLNMRREGVLLQNAYFKVDSDGQPIWFDTYEYEILKSEWHKLK